MIRKSVRTTLQDITYTFSRAEVLDALERNSTMALPHEGTSAQGAMYSTKGLDDQVVISVQYRAVDPAEFMQTGAGVGPIDILKNRNSTV
jgi:hypothetical protein